MILKKRVDNNSSLIIILIVIIWVILGVFSALSKIENTEIRVDNQWSTEPIVVDEPQPNVYNNQQKIIFSWNLVVNDLLETNYPSFSLQKPIEDVILKFEIDVIDRMKNSWYLRSSNYFFAFRFFVWEFWKGWYYNVFRKANNWVWNDSSKGLNGAIPWTELKWWYNREIPITESVVVARPVDQYGYITLDLATYLNQKVWEEIHVGWYLSSVSEFEWWWQFTVFKKIVIEYKWDEDAVLVTQ